MNPNFMATLGNSGADPAILEKLDKQEALLRQNYENASVLDDKPALSKKTTAEAPVSPLATAFDQGTTKMAHEIAQQADTQAIQALAASAGVNAAKSISERIAAREQELHITGAPIGASKNPKLQAYLDEYGQETWYVKNISNGHVIISDIADVKVERGFVADLLKMASIDDIRKSRNLREALDNPRKKLLVRLTPEEYLTELDKMTRNQQEITRIRDSYAGVNQNNTNKIRPLVESYVEKFNLGQNSNPEIAVKGLTKIEFIEWAMTENLNDEEVDLLIGCIKDNEVRRALYAKKATINS